MVYVEVLALALVVYMAAAVLALAAQVGRPPMNTQSMDNLLLPAGMVALEEMEERLAQPQVETEQTATLEPMAQAAEVVDQAEALVVAPLAELQAEAEAHQVPAVTDRLG